MPENVRAVVVKVDPAKRFGFARVPGQSQDYFFHFNDLPKGRDSVEKGAWIRGTARSEPKGPRLIDIEVDRASSFDPYYAYATASITLGLFFTVVVWQMFNAAIMTAVFIAINAVAFIFMGFDKAAAQSGSYRTPESILFTSALIGGSLGVFLGMHIFRHKIRKAKFNFVLLLIFLAQIALLRGL